MRRMLGFALVIGIGCAACLPDPSPLPLTEARPTAGTESTAQACGAFHNRLYTEEHFVATSDGAVLHVIERTSDRAMARFHPRAILLLTATLATNVQYDADVPGDDSYNALDRLAEAGFHAYAVTYEGYGLSSHPPDGRLVTAERLLAQAGEILLWVRTRTGAQRVDVMGSSIGSSLAVALGGSQSPVPTSAVGRLVLTSHVYKSVTPLMESLLFSPETRAMLEGAPDGYVPTVPQAYGILLSEATPEAAAWSYATFPDVYAVGPTLEGFDLPVFDATLGSRPALQFWGTADLVTPEADAQLFQAEYGGPVGLAVLTGGGHAPYFEPVREDFWRRVLLYLQLPWPLSLPLASTPP